MSKRRKITFTVINDLMYDQRMQKICTSLSQHGYDIQWIGRKLDTEKKYYSPLYRTKRIRCVFNNGKLFYLEYNVRLLFLLIFTKTDIYSAVDCDTLWPNYLASVLRRKPLVFDAHELFSEVPEVISRPKVQRVWRYTEKQLIPKTRVSYTVSGKIAEYYEALYGKPFGVIRNAPILQQSKQVIETEEKGFILYQGALNEGRGLENLLIAMQQVDCLLVLIGEGDLSKKLRAMTKELNLESKVIFKGFLKPEEMVKYTFAAKIGVNVSENKGLSYYYSLNNKFFDYVHAGLPAITNNFPEYVALNKEHEVALICESNAQDMASKINLLLNDNQLYNKLEENCLLASRVLNWQREEKKLIAIYDSIQ